MKFQKYSHILIGLAWSDDNTHVNQQMARDIAEALKREPSAYAVVQSDIVKYMPEVDATRVIPVGPLMNADDNSDSSYLGARDVILAAVYSIGAYGAKQASVYAHEAMQHRIHLMMEFFEFDNLKNGWHFVGDYHGFDPDSPQAWTRDQAAFDKHEHQIIIDWRENGEGYVRTVPKTS
jgi:hypothetical protein